MRSASVRRARKYIQRRVGGVGGDQLLRCIAQSRAAPSDGSSVTGHRQPPGAGRW